MWERLTVSERFIVSGAALMFIASILPWYKQSFADCGLIYNGWEGPGALLSFLAVFISTAQAAQVIFVRMADLPAPRSASWPTVHLVGAGVVIFLLMLKFVTEPSYVTYGFFLGIIAAGLLAAGGYLMYDREKTRGLNQ
jgi:hypothetical protein